MTVVILAFVAGFIAGILLIVSMLRLSMSENAIGCILLFGGVIVSIFLTLMMATRTLIAALP